jgi:hypothetical protein
MLEMSRSTTALLGGLAFFVLPLLLVSLALSGWLSENIEDFTSKVTPLAQELAKYLESTEILAGIFLIMLVGGIAVAAIFYLLFCGIGVILLLILRELREGSRL